MPANETPDVGAEKLFRAALDWLGDHYCDYTFYIERDLVYTVQGRLNTLIEEGLTSLRVFNDYPMIPGPRRSLSTDLALLDASGNVRLAAEFKYEPCHRRKDVLRNKLPVTSWAEITKDVDRVRQYVNEKRAEVAYAVVIDEGNYLAQRDLSVYADRERWGGWPCHSHDVEALILRFGPPPARTK